MVRSEVAPEKDRPVIPLLSNALAPILVTLDGIAIIDVKEPVFWNALLPMVRSEVAPEKDRPFIPLPLNALNPILVTLDGIAIIDAKEPVFWNA